MILSIIALETYRALSYQFPFMLSITHKPFMLNDITESRYAECRYAECRYAECRSKVRMNNVNIFTLGHCILKQA
jgi:hypothetical protein